MDAAGQLTQLVHRVAKLRRGLLEPSAELGVVRLRHPPRLLEPHRDARQVLLGSVMEGSLDAPALCVARSHEPDARGAQLGQLRAQEPSELLVLDVRREGLVVLLRRGVPFEVGRQRRGDRRPSVGAGSRGGTQAGQRRVPRGRASSGRRSGCPAPR